jgi:serine phosphatase RsbU (regulator of sigma subunit)
VPIVLPEHDETIGGIYIERSGEASLLEVSMPLVQSLAAQIASVLHTARLEEEAATRRRIEQELTLAGRIQMSLLPDRPPDLVGWQVEVALEPARETSGDFFDFIPLAGGRWGIVIADVADKGVGAALFMALSRTLIRTYARQYPDRADLVLSEVSERILSEARAGLFVTVFYAILDPSSGTLSYCNAGHPPPYLADRRRKSLRQLTRTGMALGVVEGERWLQRQVQLDPGDLLLLYTDGLTDALDPAAQSFGRRRLEGAIESRPDAPASALKEDLLSEVRRFAAGGPQVDDLTLVVLVKED